MTTEIMFTLNGSEVRADVEPHDRLIDTLRISLGQSGTKEGCGEGECGACTVLVDGRAVNACLFVALEVEGKSVTTIEGLLQEGGTLCAVQRAFVEKGGVQCGFCTPGMVMSTEALLGDNPSPSDDEIRQGLVGNLCRCTGYVQIIESVAEAARAKKGATR